MFKKFELARQMYNQYWGYLTPFQKRNVVQALNNNKTIIKPRKTVSSVKKTKLADKYKAIRKKDCPNKIRVNNLIADLIKKDSRLKKGTALILDAETTLTLRTLLAIGYPKYLIDSVNYIEDTYKQIKAHHRQTYHMLLGDYIDMIGKIPENKHSVTVAFPDYCCSIKGNKDMKPREDLIKFFTYKLLAKPSLLAITFSWRAGKKEVKEGHFESLTKLDNLITQTAKDNGYLAVIKDGLSYKGSMFFRIYKIH